MHRAIMVVVICLGLVLLAESTTKAQSRVALVVKLKGELERACVPRGSKLDEVESELAVSLHGQIVGERHWDHFCWKLETFNGMNPAKVRILIELTDLSGNSGEVLVAIRLGIDKNDYPPLRTFRLNDGRGISYPRGTLLERLLAEHFKQQILMSKDACEELHQVLRTNLRVAEGVIQDPAAGGETVGVVMLPWEEYGRYGQAKFSFRYASQGMLVNLPSEGVNSPLLYASRPNVAPKCCIRTRLTQRPAMPRKEPVDVFLELPFQEVLKLPLSAQVSCSGLVSSGVTVPVAY